MLGGVGRARMVARSAAAEIDVLGIMSFGILREQKRFWSSQRKRHTKCDEGEVTIEQYRAVDTGERSEFFRDPLGFGQKGVSKQAAKCHVGPGTLARCSDALRVAQPPR